MATVLQAVKKWAPSVLIASSLMTASMLANVQAHDGNQKLAGVVLDRDADKRARDASRRPVQTLSFFHVEPGMKVAEALPGGGWYSEILANYLGAEGALYGINYNESMWPLFGFFTPERIAEMSARTAEFPDMVADLSDNGIASRGFTFATVPDDIKGTLDRVLFVRALHNLARFEEQAGTMTEAITAAFELLNADGLVGVVQHRAPEDADETWASGGAGYLKQSSVIKAFESAGFELVALSEINANALDKPTSNDVVWRLPPSLNGSADDPQMREAMLAIGESDRMTLLFKKKGATFHGH
ncbi:methyltransferase [Glaciecola sp. XM2]|jgi:predicted methyltransferase|uniref:class I SAM-dependent methyltransferase n=1 Tax=Glaciecola sp. XM2 TaxID=1914931 RepID=UPI001BDE4334|nr:methyltransferase [Glaciecola sp. XM2]MBT1452002.1 methyltransferase [Glaciecola sp. XM2]